MIPNKILNALTDMLSTPALSKNCWLFGGVSEGLRSSNCLQSCCHFCCPRVARSWAPVSVKYPLDTWTKLWKCRGYAVSLLYGWLGASVPTDCWQKAGSLAKNFFYQWLSSVQTNAGPLNEWRMSINGFCLWKQFCLTINHQFYCYALLHVSVGQSLCYSPFNLMLV